MGQYLSCCCGCSSFQKCWSVCHSARRNRFESGSLVEFENLIEEVEYRQPTSILTGREKELLKTKEFEVLCSEQTLKDAELAKQLAQQEEALELEEEAAIEARREAARVSRIAQSPEIIDPTKLAFTTNLHSWVTSENGNEWAECIPSRQQARFGDRYNGLAQSKPMHPVDCANPSKNSNLNFKLDQPAQSSNGVLRETANSTPPSSIDLEWENEEGLTPPTNVAASVTDDDDDDDITSMAITSTPSNVSRRSTPLSNGNDLEWDGDFNSTHVTDIDTETEQLITEIERMTSKALSETDPER